MSISAFITKHKQRYDFSVYLNDISAAQRQEWIRDALFEYSATYPRVNRRGVLKLINGRSEALLPLDYKPSNNDQEIEQLRSLINGGATIPRGEIVPPTLYPNNYYNQSLYYGGYNGYSSGFGMPTFNTSYYPGSDRSIPLTGMAITTSDRGRYVVSLGSNSTSTSSPAIIYNASHSLEDAGVQLTISTLPSNGDTLIVGTKTYTLKTSASLTDDIQIQSTIFDMADTIADRVITDNVAIGVPDGSLVLLRPVSLNTTLSVTCDGTRITKSTLPAINSIPSNQQWIVFELLMERVLNGRATQRNQPGGNQLAEIDKDLDLAKECRNRVKPYLLIGR